MKEEEFLGLVLSSSIGLEAILFGVFGVLYSVFALFWSMVTPAEPLPPPICARIRRICKFLSVLMGISMVSSAPALYHLTIPGFFNKVAVIMLALPVLGMFLVAVYLAFFAMGLKNQ